MNRRTSLIIAGAISVAIAIFANVHMTLTPNGIGVCRVVEAERRDTVGGGRVGLACPPQSWSANVDISVTSVELFAVNAGTVNSYACPSSRSTLWILLGKVPITWNPHVYDGEGCLPRA